MLTMIVTEDRLPLAPVTADDFLAGLEARFGENESATAGARPAPRRTRVAV